MPRRAVRPQFQYCSQGQIFSLEEKVLRKGKVKTYRLSALIAALILQGLLVQPGVVPMPREKIASPVDGHGLVDVGGHKVVEPVPDARDQRGRRLGRLGHQTLDGADVVLALVTAERAPLPSDPELAQRAAPGEG